MSEACARYHLTTEEVLGWQTQVDQNGPRAHGPPAFKTPAKAKRKSRLLVPCSSARHHDLSADVHALE